MPGFIQVRTVPVATAGVPFACTVFVVNAQPGDIITVRLTQQSGMPPYYSARADIQVAGDGGGFHTFPDVVLHGPGTDARLVADDIVSAFPVVSGNAHISVVQP